MITPYSDSQQPTFVSVNSTDYIQIDPRTFIYLYNDSGTDDVVVVSASEADREGNCWCYTNTLPAAGELIIGPFSAVYAPTITVTHSYLTGVVMAVLTFPEVNTQPYTVTLHPGAHTTIGPFDYTYFPKVRIVHSTTTGVTMATLSTDTPCSWNMPTPTYTQVTTPYRATIADDTYFQFINAGVITDTITVQPVYCPNTEFY